MVSTQEEAHSRFRFARSADDVRDALDGLCQRDSIQQYCDKFMDFAILIHNMTQEKQCHQICKGIHESELQAKLHYYPPE